jgi:hypothetical protein
MAGWGNMADNVVNLPDSLQSGQGSAVPKTVNSATAGSIPGG